MPRSRRVLSLVRPGCVGLDEWFATMGIGAEFVASEWLRQLTFDIEMLGQDRDSRNDASYRPTALSSTSPKPVAEAMAFVAAMWEVLAPGPSGGFPQLDAHILKQSLRWRHLSGNSTSSIQEVGLATDTLNITGMSSDSLKRFLLSTDTSPILASVSQRESISHPDYSMHMLARAAFLLRIASGSCSNLLEKAGVNVDDHLHCWWDSCIGGRRLCPPGTAMPSAYSDLWTDIEDTLDAVDSAVSSGAVGCYHTLWKEVGGDLWTLGTTDRAFLWGMIP